MSQLVEVADHPPQSNSTALITAIARAASDPSCDIDKMERLMLMHERMEAKRAVAEFNTDLAAMQTELPSIGERGDANGRYTYALWEDVNAAVKPVLSQFGFALSFRTDFSEGIQVTGVLSHRSGHDERTTIKLPADKSGNKSDVQAVASSISYGKRYAATALLNLTSHGEDDDAFKAGRQQHEESAEVAELAESLNVAADGGRDAFGKAWAAITPDQRRSVAHRLDEFKAKCKAVA